jgi:hypothetical protein
MKNNFVGFENPRLYSETYYGTKDLVQKFVDEAETSLAFLLRTNQLDAENKRALFKHLGSNFGRTALCLSGGATFAYYHFGVAKALMDAELLPEVITGTSGGALVAALLCTRTDEELKKLLVPALAHRITACHESILTWSKRWYKTGARFDSDEWAKNPWQFDLQGGIPEDRAYTERLMCPLRSPLADHLSQLHHSPRLRRLVSSPGICCCSGHTQPSGLDEEEQGRQSFTLLFWT